MSKTSILKKTNTKIKQIDPIMYKVIILNDDYTTVDFVVDILLKVFNKSYQEAVELTHIVHQKGSGLCGTYTYDIAITKIKQVHKNARKNEFPLKLICEEV